MPPLVLCIGCNWMHKLSKKSDDIEIAEEGEQRRLWTWLVLCNDCKKLPSFN
jgi:hypothetical protein